MHRILLPARRDRRGVATVEFAFALPIVFLMMFGLADVMQVGRANLRAQSAAIQVGQVLSQCQQVNSNDAGVLTALARKVLDPEEVKNAPFKLRINVFGKDGSTTPQDFNWSMTGSGGTYRPGEQPVDDSSSEGRNVPTGYAMGKNQALIRTEVFLSVDKTPLQRLVSVLRRNTQASTAVPFSFGTAKGTAVFSTRVPNTNSLKSLGGNAGKGCLT